MKPKLRAAVPLPALLLSALFLPVLLQPAPALAHNVALWAEVRENRVWVEAYDSEGNGIQAARILVEDRDGKLLLEGKTDEKGKFDFAPPNKDEMVLVLELDAHHRSSFRLEAKDLEEVVLEKSGG